MLYCNWLVSYKDIKKLNLDVKGYENNLNVVLESLQNEYSLKVFANSIVPDFKNIFGFYEGESSVINKILIDLDIERAKLKNSVELKDIKGKLSCSNGKCSSDIIKMKLTESDKIVGFVHINTPKNSNSLVLKTNAASMLLKGLDVYKELYKGKLELKLSNYYSRDRRYKKQGMKGSFLLRDFEAIKTSIFAKLLLMTPFSQIVDTIKGAKMISFKTMKGDFRVVDGKVILANTVADGDMLSMTMEGVIDLKQDKIDIQGRLIPTCLLNVLIPKILDPKAAKNKESKLISTSYTISGKATDPKINVNPISALISFLTKPLSII